MIILIDAYNMIKQLLRSTHITDTQRADFLAQLSRYAKRKKHTLVVVFDGGPYQWVHGEQKGGLQIIYSGAHATADDYIMQYLDEHQHAQLVLVSTDHEIVSHASALFIPSIASRDFYRLVQHAAVEATTMADSAGEVVKSNPSKQTDIDRLMEAASKVVPVKHADRTQHLHKEIIRENKVSKVERKLRNILKKL